MKYTIVALMAALIAFAAAHAAVAAGEAATTGEAASTGAAVKIAIVDVKRVVEECKYKTLYEGRIKELIQQKQIEGLDLKREVEAKIDELKREAFLRSDEAKEELDRQIRAEEKRLNDFRLAASKAIEERNGEYSDELEAKVKSIVQAAAEEHGINIVINSMAIIYKNQVVDLTDVVLQRLDEAYRAEYGEGADGAAKGAGTGGTDAKGN